MDRGEREIREIEAGRIVTVCDVLVTAVTHCNAVGLHFTGSKSHGTNIRFIYPPFLKHTHTLTHIYGPISCVRDRQGSTSGFNTPGYKLFGYVNTLIYTFTDGNTVFTNHCCSDTCYGLNIFLVPTFRWRLQCLGVKCSDDAEHYSSLHGAEKAGIYLLFLRCKIHSSK